jgi:hypothetical protein
MSKCRFFGFNVSVADAIYHLIKLSPASLGLQLGVLPSYMDLQDFPSAF